MDVQWVRIVSWHIVRTPTRMFDTYVTLCGRRATGLTLDQAPANEATCEHCYRVYMKDA